MPSKNPPFYSTRSISNSWTWYLFKKAYLAFVKEQAENEDWYLKAVLDLNEDGKYFRQQLKGVRSGDRKKDLLYDLWNEEDIRLHLARLLHEVGGRRCSIHGQVFLKKRYLRGKKKGSTRRRKFPDLYFVVKKRREHNSEALEKNVESGAVEIKYFYEGWGDYIKGIAKTDLKKLVSYCERGLTPPADGGFFVCVDETGVAVDILHDIFKLRQFKKKPLAFAVFTPQYAAKKRSYPRDYEKVDPSIRKLHFVLDTALGKIARRDGTYKPLKIRSDDWSFYFDLKGKLRGGYVALVFKEFAPGPRPKRCSIIIKSETYIGDPDAVEWCSKKDRYEYTEKESKYREYRRLRSRNFNDLEAMDDLANDIAKIVARLHDKANI